MKIMASVSVLSLVVGLASIAFAQPGGGLKSYSVKSDFDDVTAEVEDAIINRGFVIDYHGFIANMLKRTRKDVGGGKEIYRDAEFYQFCSAKLSREMMEIDPQNIGYCPYVIHVFEAESQPGVVHVGYRQLAVSATGNSKRALEEVDKLLHDIVREVTK